MRKLKGNQPISKKSTICLAQLEEEDADDSEDPKSDDPDGLEGVMEVFMVQLARAVKDAQMDKKCCYHCSSPKHFICNCQLMKTTRDKKQLNGKEGDGNDEGTPDPFNNNKCHKDPPKGGSGGIRANLLTPFSNPDPFQ